MVANDRWVGAADPEAGMFSLNTVYQTLRGTHKTVPVLSASLDKKVCGNLIGSGEAPTTAADEDDIEAERYFAFVMC
jgi:hypothetical protein